MLETHYISSPEIESIGYDPEIGELHIRMRDGKEKILSGIKTEVYTKLMQSGSKAEFLRNLIESI
ncbi:KTSC domain-containing protein [Leptospira sp. 201903071]|uniref:KTSC domain-containing protein n=1 Tax=Leptospira ainazelensis TaxID=2810034 RepID=UPI001964D970|nr:KTSC domain-containing protein [Leptospira ainazelensis]MBM9501207.1 KTSC domain-containing protein [Leptospira ainazelensis]